MSILIYNIIQFAYPSRMLFIILVRYLRKAKRMSGVEIKQVAPSVGLGEGPYWSQEDKALLFVDIVNGDVHRLFLETGRHQVLHVEADESGASVSLVIPVEGDRDLFLVGLGRSLAVVRWAVSDPDRHAVKAEAVLHTDPQSPTNRFNDGKCDPQGRLWAGTMGFESTPGEPRLHQGSLFRLGHDLQLSHMVDKISIANGLAWSHDKKTFYYIDSCTYCVEAFDYDDNTGSISNRRPVLGYKAAGLQKDIPDGMCIDEAGNLWVANFYGKKVICVDPHAGKILRTVELPAQLTTSVCWGGPDYSTLFVTSARTGLTEEQLAAEPGEGGTFAITGLGARGVPPTKFKADMSLLRAKLAK